MTKQNGTTAVADPIAELEQELSVKDLELGQLREHLLSLGRERVDLEARIHAADNDPLAGWQYRKDLHTQHEKVEAELKRLQEREATLIRRTSDLRREIRYHATDILMAEFTEIREAVERQGAVMQEKAQELADEYATFDALFAERYRTFDMRVTELLGVDGRMKFPVLNAVIATQLPQAVLAAMETVMKAMHNLDAWRARDLLLAPPASYQQPVPPPRLSRQERAELERSGYKIRYYDEEPSFGAIRR